MAITFIEGVHFSDADGQPFSTSKPFKLGDPDISSVRCDEYSLETKRVGGKWSVVFKPAGGPELHLICGSRPTIYVAKP